MHFTLSLTSRGTNPTICFPTKIQGWLGKILVRQLDTKPVMRITESTSIRIPYFFMRVHIWKILGVRRYPKLTPKLFAMVTLPHGALFSPFGGCCNFYFWILEIHLSMHQKKIGKWFYLPSGFFQAKKFQMTEWIRLM